MASIANDSNGRRRILFMAPDGSRKTLRLGALDRKSADSIARHVEILLNAKISGQPIRQETATWLTDIGPVLRDKLAAVGLIELQQRMTLGNFLDTFIENRKPTAAANTITNLDQVRKRLVGYFGSDRAMNTISEADAEKWAGTLATRYSPCTAGRTIKRAKQFFASALRQKVVNENPFLHLKASSKINKDRQFHVSRVLIDKVIDAAPNSEWRLLIALSRFGGLRCPSEHLALKWSDIDWGRDRFRVDSSKTGERWVPIFPELKPHLEECFEMAQPGAVYVISRYRESNSNLRTTFGKIIRRAGEKPWPKLFHNLRASRETELAERFPIHVVCGWIGNSAAVANKHYLTIRDEDFEKASKGEKGGAKSGALVAQKAAQQGAARIGIEPHKKTQPHENHEVVPNIAGWCNSLQNALIPPRGLEPLS